MVVSRQRRGTVDRQRAGRRRQTRSIDRAVSRRAESIARQHRRVSAWLRCGVDCQLCQSGVGSWQGCRKPESGERRADQRGWGRPEATSGWPPNTSQRRRFGGCSDRAVKALDTHSMHTRDATVHCSAHSHAFVRSDQRQQLPPLLCATIASVQPPPSACSRLHPPSPHLASPFRLSQLYVPCSPLQPALVDRPLDRGLCLPSAARHAQSLQSQEASL